MAAMEGHIGDCVVVFLKLSLPTQPFHVFHAIFQLCVENPLLSMLLLFGVTTYPVG